MASASSPPADTPNTAVRSADSVIPKRDRAHAPMVAARGGTHNGGCRPGRPRAVDWIFGSQGVQFTHYVEDRSRLVDFTTDHPVVTAGVHLIGKPGT